MNKTNTMSIAEKKNRSKKQQAILNRFGTAMQEKREEKGLSIDELGKKLKCTTRMSLARYEDAEVEPGMTKALELAQILGFSLDSLFKRKYSNGNGNGSLESNVFQGFSKKQLKAMFKALSLELKNRSKK